MITRKYLNNKVSKLRQEIREETQHVFSLYAKKGKITEIRTPGEITFYNNITKIPCKSIVDHIILQDTDTVIYPEGNDLDPVKLSKIMSIDDLMKLHAIAIQLEKNY